MNLNFGSFVGYYLLVSFTIIIPKHFIQAKTFLKYFIIIIKTRTYVGTHKLISEL